MSVHHLAPRPRRNTPVGPPPAYAELVTATNFSFLRGASHPQEMVAQGAELGMRAIGIADRNTFAGVVRAYAEAKRRAGARAVTLTLMLAAAPRTRLRRPTCARRWPSSAARSPSSEPAWTPTRPISRRALIASRMHARCAAST